MLILDPFRNIFIYLSSQATAHHLVLKILHIHVSHTKTATFITEMYRPLCKIKLAWTRMQYKELIYAWQHGTAKLCQSFQHLGVNLGIKLFYYILGKFFNILQKESS